jgi:hypothetical protein
MTWRAAVCPLGLAFLVPALALSAAAESLSWGAPGAPRAPWREIRYARPTRYEVRADGGESVLRAESHGQHAALVREVRVDPRGARLAWRWRVLAHPSGADPERRPDDDRAAGVIVTLRRSVLPWRTRALLYQWTPARPRGEWSYSPYSRNVRTLVLEDAPADSSWRTEERDLGADLALAFGEPPERIEAVGVLCDTDNTRGHAIAEFGALSLGPPAP